MSILIQIQLNKLHEVFTTIEKYFSYLDIKLLYKIMFISEEILTNIEHYAEFLEKKPDISLTLKDNAREFNMLEYPDADVDADIQNRELGGLGIYLTKKYAKKSWSEPYF